MNENTIVITENGSGGYRLENNGLSEFALVGILECVVFDLKSAAGKITPPVDAENAPVEPIESAAAAAEAKRIEPEAENPLAAAAATPDLRQRIGNAVKAVRALGGEIEDMDLGKLSETELRTELEELTEQYKRLKNSKVAK